MVVYGCIWLYMAVYGYGNRGTKTICPPEGPADRSKNEGKNDLSARGSRGQIENRGTKTISEGKNDLSARGSRGQIEKIEERKRSVRQKV
jgi:hypothetical protein